MEQKRPGWVDKPEFDWTPQPPLPAEPPAPNDARLSAPDFNPANDTSRSSPLRLCLTRALDWFVVHAWHVASRSGEALRQFTLPDLTPRLTIGLGQGLFLSLLLFLRDQITGNTGIMAGLIMATAFAPLALVQGLDRIPLRPLLTWAGAVALGLIGLGAYHAWRITGTESDHAGLWLAAMIAIFLFVGQALLLGHARSAPGPLRYAVLYESSWRLTVEILLCSLFALLVWSACKFGGHLLVPGVTALPRWFAIPLATFSFAAASQMRAGALLHLLKRSAVIFSTATLPPLILSATITILFGALSHWQPPLLLCGLQGLLLVIGINASYRGGHEWRPLWRRYAEFLAACLLPPLALLGVLAMQSRTAQYGFTGPRIIAMACMMLFIAYALTYAGAALLSLGGGRWMERIESVNLPMAFVAMSLIATLASPLGDPVRLAVANQNWRMLHGRVAPEAFDYAYLRYSGLKFGRAGLEGQR